MLNDEKAYELYFFVGRFFVLGLLSSWIYFRAKETLLPGPFSEVPYYEFVPVSPDLEKAFNKTLINFQESEKISPIQMGELFRRSEFTGFRESSFKKASVIQGRGYSSSAWGEINLVQIDSGQNKSVEVSRINQTTVVTIDSKNHAVKSVAVLEGNASIQDVDFLVFTPTEIYQFTFDSAWGRKYSRTPHGTESIGGINTEQRK